MSSPRRRAPRNSNTQANHKVGRTCRCRWVPAVRFTIFGHGPRAFVADRWLTLTPRLTLTPNPTAQSKDCHRMSKLHCLRMHCLQCQCCWWKMTARRAESSPPCTCRCLCRVPACCHIGARTSYILCSKVPLVVGQIGLGVRRQWGRETDMDVLCDTQSMCWPGRPALCTSA